MTDGDPDTGMTENARSPAGPEGVGQPHDGLFKAILGRPENAASEIRSILTASLATRLDLDQLERIDGSFVDETLRQQHTDLLFRTQLDQTEAIIYVLLEHQSRPDHWMALRMCDYLIRIWRRHLDLNPGRARLPPIIPVVIYQGRARWTPPLDLAELVATDDDTAAFTPKFSYLLDDLHRIDPADLRSRPLTQSVRLSFVLMREAPGSEHLTQSLHDWLTDLRGIIEKRLADLEILWTYALTVSNTPEPELTNYLAQLGPEAKEVAMTTADLLRAEGEARGRAEGEAHGRTEGRAETLLELLNLKFSQLPAGTEALVRSASASQLETWTRRILTAATLDEVLS